MRQEEREKYNRTPVEIVFTRSCKAKINDDAKVKEFAVGQEEKVIHRFADELLSLKKAVVKGSPEHVKWIADEKKKEESRKELHPKTISTAEALAKVAAALEENTKAVNPLLAENAKTKK